MATNNTTTLAQARAAKPKVLRLLASLPVAGVGITRIGDGYGLKVNFSENVADESVPDHCEGVPITKEVVGTIRKR